MGTLSLVSVMLFILFIFRESIAGCYYKRVYIQVKGRDLPLVVMILINFFLLFTLVFK
jgi:hypothetical protein